MIVSVRPTSPAGGPRPLVDDNFADSGGTTDGIRTVLWCDPDQALETDGLARTLDRNIASETGPLASDDPLHTGFAQRPHDDRPLRLPLRACAFTSVQDPYVVRPDMGIDQGFEHSDLQSEPEQDRSHGRILALIAQHIAQHAEQPIDLNPFVCREKVESVRLNGIAGHQKQGDALHDVESLQTDEVVLRIVLKHMSLGYCGGTIPAAQRTAKVHATPIDGSSPPEIQCNNSLTYYIDTSQCDNAHQSLPRPDPARSNIIPSRSREGMPRRTPNAFPSGPRDAG